MRQVLVKHLCEIDLSKHIFNQKFQNLCLFSIFLIFRNLILKIIFIEKTQSCPTDFKFLTFIYKARMGLKKYDEKKY